MLNSFLHLQKDSEQDDGHFSVLVQRTSCILSVKTVHKENGTKWLNWWWSHTTTRELQTCTFQGPQRIKHHQNSTKGPPPREKKERKMWREREKKREISGPQPFGPPTLRAPPFGAPPFGPHPLWSQNSTSKNWAKSKLAEVEIGRSRIGQVDPLLCRPRNDYNCFSHNYFCKSALSLQGSRRNVWRIWILSRGKTRCRRTVKFRVHANVINTNVPLNNDDPTHKELLLRRYGERIERLSQQDKLSKFCMDAGFLTVVEVGQDRISWRKTLKNSHNSQMQWPVVSTLRQEMKIYLTRKVGSEGTPKLGPFWKSQAVNYKEDNKIEWLQLTGKILHGNNYLWLVMKNSSVSRTRRFTYFQILCYALDGWARTPNQILFWKKSWLGSRVHHNTKLWT